MIKPTRAAIAQTLGISRQTLALHMRKTDAPALTDIKAWQTYLAAHGRVGSASPELRKAISQKRLEILTETKIKLARENEVASGILVNADEVMLQCAEAGGLFMSELERLARELPPALAGLPAGEVAERIDLEVEKVRKKIRTKMKEIAP